MTERAEVAAFPTAAARPGPVRIGLIGAGRIGSSHARLIGDRVPGASLVGVADAVQAAAEASFSATYGYDVRAEVFGSSGMVTVGDQARSSMAFAGVDGRRVDTVRGDVELFADAYAAEFVAFSDAVRSGSEAHAPVSL